MNNRMIDKRIPCACCQFLIHPDVYKYEIRDELYFCENCSINVITSMQDEISEVKMTNNIFKDMSSMHDKYKVNDWVKNNPEKLIDLLKFRIKFLEEEFNETRAAVNNYDAEEVVDGLIDLIVVAAGTLDIFGIDGEAAWNEVHKANMSKEVGVKSSRPNPLGLPDLIKPEGWVAPSHEGNHGLLGGVLK